MWIYVQIPSAMKRTLLSILLTTMMAMLPAQDLQKLSEESTISLLTCGTGEALYAYFGHSALRVADQNLGIDRIYNYGTFDFNTPNFYGRFLTGTPEYMLSVSSFPYFYAEYVSENRSIREQVLNLNDDEKQRLYELLEINFLPENRYYRYDFLFDNCSSRIRDIVLLATRDRFLLVEPDEPLQTFRQLLQPYITHSSWLALGINLLLAGGTDEKAGFSQYMFLPDEMERLFRYYENREGQSLVSAERIIYLNQPDNKSATAFSAPVLIAFILAAALILTWFYRSNGWAWNLFDTILYMVAGAAGIIMVFLWFFSEYTVINANLNLTWAFPPSILLALFIWFKKLYNLVKIYCRIMILLSTGLLMLLSSAQTIPMAGYLLFILVLTRMLSRTGWIDKEPLLLRKPGYRARSQSAASPLCR